MTVNRLQCNYFIKKKNRQCGMTRKQGREYCSEHCILDDEERVPCPLDPNHTVNKFKLNKHLQKCNKFKLRHLNDKMSFYKFNLNQLDESVDKFKLNIELTIDLLDKLNKSNKFLFIPTQSKENKFMSNTRFTNLQNQKHAIQQSSLIQNLLEFKLQNNKNNKKNKNYNLIEYGCGRAEFSRYFIQVFQSMSININNLILIDRASNRLKFDSKIISDSQNTPPTIKRVKIDIKDLYIDDLLQDNNIRNIIISKHLCGVATDLTLRSIKNNPILNSSIDSICIAMCCRHVCHPDQYINKPFIQNILDQYDSPLSYNDFFYTLTKLCSWATNGKRTNIQQDCDLVEIYPGNFITIKQREDFGIMARQIIDQGRLEWVKSNIPNSKASLIKYVSKDISLENVALLLTI
ncbi:tRNA:m(4)X modification enzyme Trm13p [Monosporozyma unispora]